jgi:hypothetical protein
MRIAILVALTALIGSSLVTGCASFRAQIHFPPDPSTQSTDLLWNAVLAIPVGSSLQVDFRTGESSIEGQFRSANGQTLVLGQGSGNRSVPRTEIQRVLLDRGAHTKKGALWGLGIGAITGLATSSLLVANADYPVDGEGILVAVFTAMFAGIGAGIGALIGTLVPEWTVIYETPVPETTN